MNRIIAILIGIMMLLGIMTCAMAEQATTNAVQENAAVVEETADAGDEQSTEPPFTTLRRGSRGDLVIALQWKLKELGYEIDSVDGIFGKRTEAALRAFQKDMGWEATGIIDNQETLDIIIDIIKGDGVNLLMDSDCSVEKDSASEEIKTMILDVKPDVDLQALIGQTLTLSVFINTPGERGSSVSDESNYMYNRFGCHLAIKWSDSTGALEDKMVYPCTELLSQTVENTRISSSYKVVAPEGYDTISQVFAALQLGARPAEGNTSIWKIGYPKLEIGSIATEWTNE